MRLARVIGTATATAKYPGLAGHKLLMVDVVESDENVITPSVVAVDTVGAGVGDLCILAEGSAARIPQTTAGLPVDACLIAIVDEITIAKQKQKPK